MTGENATCRAVAAMPWDFDIYNLPPEMSQKLPSIQTGGGRCDRIRFDNGWDASALTPRLREIASRLMP